MKKIWLLIISLFFFLTMNVTTSATESIYNNPMEVNDVDYPSLTFDNFFDLESRSVKETALFDYSLALVSTSYNLSLREYKSDNFLVNGVLKAFWELWDLFIEELFGG